MGGEDAGEQPFLVDNLHTRSLCFGLDGAIQSEMLLDDPLALVSAYTRKMMGFLLFHRHPRKVLMIGLGGGALAKYCHQYLPGARLTVIEIDPQVIALREQFDIPPDDARLRVVNEDGAVHVTDMARARRHTDVLLVDAFDRHGLAPAVIEPRFLRAAREVLSARGVFVMNLVADPALCVRHVESIHAAFGGAMAVVSVEDGANVVVFAGPCLRDARTLAVAVQRAPRIEGRLGLRFPTLLDLTRQLQQRAASPLAMGIAAG